MEILRAFRVKLPPKKDHFKFKSIQRFLFIYYPKQETLNYNQELQLFPQPMSSLNSWSTVTLQNCNQRCQDTKRYGHYRLILGLYISKMLTQLGMTWWLDAGNLLGAYRDGKMIAHDTDFDLAVLATQQQFTQLYLKIVPKIDANFQARKIDTFCHRIQIFDPNHGGYELDPDHKLHYHNLNFHNVTVNVQLYCSQPNNKVKLMYFRDGFSDFIAITQDQVLPLKEIKYCGHKFNCPNKVQKYLETYYEYLGLGAQYDSVTRKYRQNGKIPKNISTKADQGNHDNLKNE